MQWRNLAVPPTILVVDDDPDLVYLLTLFFSKQGMVAVPAYSGRDCLEKVQQYPIDVILLDVMMPIMDGLETCAALRKHATTRTIPIILLTARDDTRTRLAGADLGVDDFLVKPIRGKDLLARIQIQLETSRRIQELERVVAHMEGNL